MMYPSSTARAHVFVTTEQELASGNKAGRWFNLSKYPNKKDFVEQATQYAYKTFGELAPALRFTAVDAGFNVSSLIRDDAIDEQLWSALTLSNHELNLFDGWLSFYNMTEGGLLDTLRRADKVFAGFFDTHERFARTQIARLGANGHLLTAIGDCEGTNHTLLETAKTHGGSRLLLDTLSSFDEDSSFDDLVSELCSGYFEHKSHWFKI